MSRRRAKDPADDGAAVEAGPSRYDGQPLLRILECYVLWAVDELSADAAEGLVAMTPKLQSTFHRTGTWQEVVAAEMDFPPDLVDSLRALWARDLALAAQGGGVLEPEAWARDVVDSNLV